MRAGRKSGDYYVVVFFLTVTAFPLLFGENVSSAGSEVSFDYLFFLLASLPFDGARCAVVKCVYIQYIPQQRKKTPNTIKHQTFKVPDS